MTTIAAIAAGGAIGAVMRFGLARWVQGGLDTGFPAGTLAVNVLGSLVMGFASIWLLERSSLPPEARLFVLTGLLGGFTTFSAFSLETLVLMEEGEIGRAFLYVVASVSVCLGAAWLGMTAGRLWNP